MPYDRRDYLGKQDGQLFVDNHDIDNLSIRVTDGRAGDMVQVYGIDSYFKDVPIGFLKADVEGYEMGVLEGACENIKKHRPLLALCVYHQSADLYRIPRWLKEVNPDYKIDIAHHYYGYTSTVLYAY